MIKRFRAGLLAVATVGALGITAGTVGITAGAASAITTTGGFTSASIHVTNHDDSGTNSNGTTSNWALDDYGAVLHLSTSGVVPNSNCPGISIGACHKITGMITDTGHFTTVIGDAVPGQGSLNGGTAPLIGSQVTGTFHGTLKYEFFTSAALSRFKDSNSPNLGGVSGDSPSTQQWPEQFAPQGTQFWDTSGNTGGAEQLGSGPFNFTYTAALNSDSACPNVSGRWVDSSAANSNDGSNPMAGNILAPGTGNC